jgi:hypothetical protein
MNNDQLYFYNRGFNDCLAKFVDAHPSKTLTDEEIRLIHEQTDGNLNLIEFARAILKKASEKC